MLKPNFLTVLLISGVMLLLGISQAYAERKIIINGKKCTFKSEDHISMDFGSTKVTHLEKVDDQCVFRLTAEVDGQFTESVCRVPVSRKPIIIEEPTSDRSKSLTDFYDASFDLRNCRTLKTGTLEEERHKYEQRKAIGVCESLEGGTVCPDGYMDWYCTNRDLCYREMIKKFPDIRMCTQLENKVFLRECIKPIAVKEQKYEQCLLISSEENRPFRNECLEIILDIKHKITGVYYTQPKGAIIGGKVYYPGDQFDIFIVKEVQGHRMVLQLPDEKDSEINLYAK